MANTKRDLDIKSVRVLKSMLIEKLKENRKIHSKEYIEASSGYRQKLLNEWIETLKEVQTTIKELGNTTINLAKVKVDVNLPYLPQPENHTKDYDTAIEMLEWSVDDHVDLNHREFQQFVQDDWVWTENFKMSNSMYSNAVIDSPRNV